jgi:hypothetical protein
MEESGLTWETQGEQSERLATERLAVKIDKAFQSKLCKLGLRTNIFKDNKPDVGAIRKSYRENPDDPGAYRDYMEARRSGKIK